MLKKIILEPLVHFLVIAVLFFIAFDYVNKDEIEDNVIIVADGRIAEIKNSLESRWNREALPKEVESASLNYAINEMYLREARNLQMDMGDKVIDRRLRQKIEFLIEDLVASKEPSQNDLLQYYQDNLSKYQTPPKYSFTQVHLSTDRSAEELAQQIALQEQLIAHGKVPQSEVHILPKTITSQTPDKIEQIFGQGFASHLRDQQTDEWQGPFLSALGTHFIYLTEVLPAKTVPFQQVKEEVLMNWHQHNLQQAKLGYERELLKNYRIVYGDKASEISADE